MSTVIHLPLLNTHAPYMSKEKTAEPFAPSFTAVNGIASPPSPHAPVGTNVTSARLSPQQTEQRPPQNGFRGSSPTTSPSTSSGLPSPDSPNKRRRSNSIEDAHNPVRTMENPPQQSLPPIDRPGEHERRWTTESHSRYSHKDMRDSRPLEPSHSSMPPVPAPHPSMATSSPYDHPHTSTSRNGVVQLDNKKRKRQFANRTKTGCGTCRRRKKKCDEAKPECNNCIRGGFVCEGYLQKIPWPKNGPVKPPPPLQAKDQMARESAAAYSRCPGCHQIHSPPHCEARSNSHPYPESRAPAVPEGARARPITVDDRERKPPAPSTWANGWPDAPRASYPEHAPPVAAHYPQPPAPSHERTPSSHEHHAMPQPQPQQQHPQPHPHPPPHAPHMYHQGPPSMGQPPSHAPITAAESHRPAQPPAHHPPIAPPNSAPPAPPQSRYMPQSRPHKTEKEKMLLGEPFLPYDDQLTDERSRCTKALHQYNNTTTPYVDIGRSSRESHFKSILQAAWNYPKYTDHRPGAPSGAHYGGNVHVDPPFFCTYGYNLSIGDNVCIGAHCALLDSARIAIGRNTTISDHVTISTLKTPSDPKLNKGSTGTRVARDVYIGENVHIGEKVMIEAGVKIGNNAIIKAGSVVTCDIAADMIAFGNPAMGQR